MSIVDFLRIFAAHFKMMVLVGIILGGVVFAGTRNPEKEYTSSTLINTGLVSGYNLESSGQKVDYAYTNNEIENLISVATSYETTEELAMRSLAKYILLKEPDENLITREGWEELKKDDVHEVRLLVAESGDFETTLATIKKYMEERQENPVQDLLNSNHRFFGIEHLQNIKVTREGKSDLLRFKYATTDAAVCRETLVELTEIFIKKYRLLKEVQSTDVLEFFKTATSDAQNALNGKEDELLGFMAQNKIINYYEQTRFIAAKKEDLDEMYFKELMEQAGADNTLKRLEKELTKQVNLPELNNRLASKRDELAKINSKIAKIEIFSFDSSSVDAKAIKFWQSRAEEVQNEIKNVANSSFIVNRTPEGVEVKNLLTQWLNQVIQTEQAVARLDILGQRKKEFETIYSRFAPWGSTLKRIERAIDVAERAYLENLHSYNQARLHQYNMMMSANLKVIDPPYLPAKAAPSKQMMLVVVAFMAGFILTFGIGIALELMDNTLKNPIRAAKVIGLEVYAAFPRFPENLEKEKIDYNFIKERSAGQLLQNINLDLLRKGKQNNKPHRIAMISTRDGEGKTFMCRLVIEKLRAAEERVAYIYQAIEAHSEHPDDMPYDANHQFFDTKNEEQLAIDDYNYIFLELPGLLTEAFPVDLVSKFDLALLVVRGNRAWNHADSKALKSLSLTLNSSPKIALNALRPDVLENSIGEIPKRRSFIRKWIKRVVKMEFSEKKTV